MIDALIERAQQLIQLQRFSQAEKELRSALAMDPNRAEALALLAICQSEQGKPDAAQQLIGEAISKEPDNDYFLYLQAMFFLRQDKIKDAERAIHNAIAYHPQNADYFGILSSIQLNQRQWNDALETADKGLAIDPDNLTCLNSRSTALFKLEKKDEAYATIREALSKDPENENTHANIGWSLLEKGDHQKALEHFREALKINPDFDLAKAGLVQGLKARYFFYRVFLKYSFWLGNFQAKGQWLIILGLFFGVKFLQRLADQNEVLALFLKPIIFLYFAFAISTWIIHPLSNLFLRLNVYGRYALTRDEVNASTYVGIALLAGAAGGIAYLVSPQLIFLALLIFGISMMIPLASMFNPPKKQKRRMLVGYAIALGIVGLIALIQIAQLGDIGIFAQIYLFGVIAYQWIANWAVVR